MAAGAMTPPMFAAWCRLPAMPAWARPLPCSQRSEPSWPFSAGPLPGRSKDVIEPVLKPQWWVDCQQMAADGCAAVRDGRLEIIPKEFETTWFRYVLPSRCAPLGWLPSHEPS